MNVPAAISSLKWFVRAPLAVHRQVTTFRGQSKEVDILDYLDSSEQHYTGSFGTQWAKYRNIQVDRFNGTQASYRHLEMFTQGNTDVLKGQTVLEQCAPSSRALLLVRRNLQAPRQRFPHLIPQPIRLRVLRCQRRHARQRVLYCGSL